MEAFEIIGTVESKTSQKGGAYLVIKTEKGNTYTLWGKEDADRLQPGVEVRFDYEQKGNFKNISAFEVLGKVKTLARTNSNDVLIAREVCLKAAVELAKANIEAGKETKSDAVLRVARVFEDWVIRE